MRARKWEHAGASFWSFADVFQERWERIDDKVYRPLFLSREKVCVVLCFVTF